VDSLAPASGLEFALLPPDNATGNFTKIVQRIPIKVVFDDPRQLAGRLRPGMSVDVAVDTRHQQPATTARQAS
jgi:membrane fusion protein (multidrug efflux system)